VRALRDGGEARVVVATYLLAPGYFADKIRDAALGAGADAVSAALGAAPEVADVVLDRYLAAAADLAGRRTSETAVHAAPAPAHERERAAWG
jgi:sirohydrochlorin ferrochelatase